SATSRVATPILGETASEGGAEGVIQGLTNGFSRDPVGQGVGGATAMGAALRSGMGAPSAAAEAGAVMQERRDPIRRAHATISDPKASNDDRMAAALELMTAGYAVDPETLGAPPPPPANPPATPPAPPA